MIFIFVCKRLSVSRYSEKLKILISEKLQNGFLLHGTIIIGVYAQKKEDGDYGYKYSGGR